MNIEECTAVYLGGASEGDYLHLGVGDDALTHSAAVAEHHVDHPVRQADGLHDLAEHPGSHTSHLTRFTDHSIA